MRQMSWIDLNGIVHVISKDNVDRVYVPLCNGALTHYGVERPISRARDSLMESLKIAAKAQQQEMPTCIACMAAFEGYR